MKQRVFTGTAIVIALALLFVLKIFVSDYFFDVFFAGVACFAGFEMAKLLTKIGKFNFKYVAAAFPSLLLAMNLIGIFLVQKSQNFFWVLYTILIDLAICFVVTLFVFLYGIIFKRQMLNEISVRNIKNTTISKFAFKKAINTLICFVYPTFLFMFFVVLNHLNVLPFARLENINSNVSVFVLVTAFLIPMLTDTFAMLTGSLIGGKKLCPKISPNKTISGSIGGVVWCVLFGACIYLIFGCIPSFVPFMEVFPIWAYLLIVLFGSCVAQGGDLFESIVKRRAGVSDSGKLLPGHGGMLDRVDSHIFMAPYILLAFWICLI